MNQTLFAVIAFIYDGGLTVDALESSVTLMPVNVEGNTGIAGNNIPVHIVQTYQVVSFIITLEGLSLPVIRSETMLFKSVSENVRRGCVLLVLKTS